MIYFEDYIKEDMFLPQLLTVKNKNICDSIICFDIETCNYFVYKQAVYSINDIIKMCKHNVKKIEQVFEESIPGAVPYIWQFCIDGRCVYGREFLDVKKMFNYIQRKTAGYKTHIWIHNYSFEYQFLQSIIKFKRKFFTDARQPLFTEYKNLVFRCSYRLTNLSLAKWGKNIGIDKKEGQLDYFELYTPKSELPADALEYCEYDVIIMYFGIKAYMDIYDHIAYIPYTQTGIVRRDIKAENKKQRNYIKKVAKMQPKTPEDWKVEHYTYSGGLTLTNPANTGRLLEGVGGIDKKSAYPFAMLEKYPCSEFILTNSDPIWDDGQHHICLVEFKNLKAKYDITPLSSAKRISMQGGILAHDNPAELKMCGISRNNGKVIKARSFVGYFTEVDMRMIFMYYDVDEIIIHSHRIALSDYMSKHIILYMLERYRQKTLLSGVDETMRAREKEKLNCIYGMCGTSLIRPEITEDDEYLYTKTRPDDIQIQAELNKLQASPFRNVLPYSHGIYITAYQRYFLMEMVHKFNIDKICYTDTDSIKGFFDATDMDIINKENERIKDWTRKRCELQDIPYEMTCPENKKGSREFLGIWEQDIESTTKTYYQIKFMGAKRYAYKLTPDDKIHITIAGVPKSAANVLKSVDDLAEGLEFDLFNSHKNLLTYLDGNNPQVIMPDGYHVKQTTAVNIRPTSYKLTLDSEYRILLKKYLKEKHY